MGSEKKMADPVECECAGKRPTISVALERGRTIFQGNRQGGSLARMICGNDEASWS
jgi:hypothetical protein